MNIFDELWKSCKKRPINYKAGYNRTDYDPYGYYNPNAEARKQCGDAFDGGEEDCMREIR